MAPARTRTTDALSAAGDGDFGSAAQRERRKRILDATLALASKGGYDAVQMRTVAERADVALGTLYRYFPSKIHLLVSALVLEFERTQEKLDRRPIPGDTPVRPHAVRAVPGDQDHAARADAHRGDDPGVHVRRPERGDRGERGRPADGADVHPGHARRRALGRRRRDRPGDRRRVAVEPGRVGDPAGFGGRREQPPRTGRPPAASLAELLR